MLAREASRPWAVSPRAKTRRSPWSVYGQLDRTASRRKEDPESCKSPGGGGGFFLACDYFGENVRQFIPRLRFFVVVVFLLLFKVKINSRKLIPLFRPRSVHGGSAS